MFFLPAWTGFRADRQDSAQGADFMGRNPRTGTAHLGESKSGADLSEIVPVEAGFAHFFIEGAPGDAKRIGGCLDVA